MVKVLLRSALVLSGLIALSAFLSSLSTARNLYLQTGSGETRSYHFSLYLPGYDSAFFSGIVAGAERAAAEMGAAISIHSIDPALNELEMASYTGVDGVIVCPYLDDALARRQLEKLDERRIPVVLINHNIPNDKPWPFIGSNNFDMGRRIGLISRDLSRDPVQLAVVYSDKAPGIYAERELVEMGIVDALGERLSGSVRSFKTNLNPLNAEDLLYRLFMPGTPAGTSPAEYDELPINIIAFTDPADTAAAAQTLVDMNLVGRIQIIGFGSDPAVVENIRKGIVSCSVAINSERIGYEAVKSLTALRTTGYTSTSINTGIDIITGNSL
jgi:ribose transport system substrate-binding protein